MRHFTYKNLDELRQSCSALGAEHVRFEPDPARVRAILARPVRVAAIDVGNSIAIHPMEGCDGALDGNPGDLTIRRYQRFAASGAKLVWFEATAVTAEGRANPRQLWLHPGNLASYASLLEQFRSIHREQFGSSDDLLEPLQLTHSGRYSSPRRIIACHNPLVDARFNTPPDYPVITDDEIERLEEAYIETARLGLAAGFRAVDVKATHGYLANELLGAKQRPGRYGGSLENRTRFLRNILGKLRSEFGTQLILAMRLGCFDGIPYQVPSGRPYDHEIPYDHGFGVNPLNPLEADLTDVKAAIAGFRAAGLDLLNVSLGCPYYNPHVGRPFEMPDAGNYEQPEHPLLGVNRHFGIAGELQRAFPDLPMVGTGYSWLQTYSINAAAANLDSGAIRFFGLGRGALAHPDFAREALDHGQLDERRVCKTLTYCTFLMRQKDHPLGQWPTGCPPFDKEVYGPLIKEVRTLQRTKA